MPVVEVSRLEVLRHARGALGLPQSATLVLDESLIAAILRRAAAILCPCSAGTLSATAVDSLSALTEETALLVSTVDAVIDSLVTYGDLLELHQVTIDDTSAKGTWLFAAPPAFVAPGGRNARYLIGVAPDDAAPLPEKLRSRIRYEGCLRVLEESPNENLTQILHEHGLVRISEESWLKLPRFESASAYRARYEQQLERLPPSGDVTSLQILNPLSDPLFYRRRWLMPNKESGSFVARRPQAYGTPIWGFAQIKDGVLLKFLDLSTKSGKWRGCDSAWHLQMAIDHDRGVPQRYRCRPAPHGVFFDFFSPLPLWAERHLAVVGCKADTFQNLMSYLIPHKDVADEETFLNERLWLERIDMLEKEN